MNETEIRNPVLGKRRRPAVIEALGMLAIVAGAIWALALFLPLLLLLLCAATNCQIG